MSWINLAVAVVNIVVFFYCACIAARCAAGGWYKGAWLASALALINAACAAFNLWIWGRLS